MWPDEIPPFRDWKRNPGNIVVPKDYKEKYYCVKPTFGADPEYFCYHKELKRPYPPPFQAEGTLNKDKRVLVEMSYSKEPAGEVQQDGFAMECNLNPVEIPVASKPEEIDKKAKRSAALVWKRLETLRDAMDSMLEPYNLELAPHSSARFWRKDYNAQPDEVREIGCAPDLLLANTWVFTSDAGGYRYTEGVNPEPTEKRYAGGHIHIGWTKDWDVTDPWHIYNASVVITWLAHVLYPTLVWMEDQVRKTEEKEHVLPRYRHRRMYSLYGNPFLCRITPYGVEWRCPSNAWTQRKDFVETVMRVIGRLFTDKSHNKRDVSYMPRGVNRGLPYILTDPILGDRFMRARDGEVRDNLVTYLYQLENEGIRRGDLLLFDMTRGM